MHPVRSWQASLQGSVNLAAPAAPSTPNNQFWLAKSQFGGEPLANHIGRDDQRSSDTRLVFVVWRRLGRSVGAWDPA
jgi:hypothetical protein